MNLDRIEIAIRSVRECHTKSQWDEFLIHFGDVLSTNPSARLISEIFRKLEVDPQSIYYNPKLWGALINGSMACWNTDTGIVIAEFSRKLTMPVVSIPAAQVLLEGGKPALSREFAQRSLRLGGISDLERIQLELIVASSFAEEGKSEHAVRVLTKITPLIHTAVMTVRERADFVVRLGRLQYFIGRYHAAAKAYEEASPLMLKLQDWEGAARALLNAGACIRNGGEDDTDRANELVERCRKLSVEHNLSGPLSHCEAFYGVEAFNLGHFMAAREHFRRALVVVPANDNTFRRLHIISFLSLTYFAMGRYVQGIKFGRQTLELAAQDSSDRFKTRYQSLEAEILWEEGKVPESMAILKEAVHQLSLHGVRNLEELSTLTRYQIQLAILGGSSAEKVRIDDALKNHKPIWLVYLYSSALLKCSLDTYEQSLEALKDCYEKAKILGVLNYQALILLAIIRLNLQKHDLDSVQHLLPALETAVSRLGDTPIRAKLQFVYAAIAYQSGEFDRTIKILSAVDKMTAVSWPDRFAAQSCMATVKGESPRFQYEWQEQLVSRFVRTYFAPTIRQDGNRSFIVSEQYKVVLDNHPAMADLVLYLFDKVPYGASLADIQTDVWKQSIQAQGWQQKIRNTVMRLRDLFPYTMAPLVVHNESLKFFSDAIRIQRTLDDSVPIEYKIKNLLRDGPMSSQQIAQEVEVSLATTKRLLKKMSEERHIHVERLGRNVLYQSIRPH